MGLLIFVTVLWAFSFSLIGEFLAGRVDSDFAVLTRVVLAALVFLPLTRWRGVPGGLKLGVLVTGMLQFGVTYLCLYRSFSYLTVPEVLLFTIFTPLYVTLIDDALYRRFSPIALVAATVATLGAGIIRYDGLSQGFMPVVCPRPRCSGASSPGWAWQRPVSGCSCGTGGHAMWMPALWQS